MKNTHSSELFTLLRPDIASFGMSSGQAIDPVVLRTGQESVGCAIRSLLDRRGLSHWQVFQSSNAIFTEGLFDAIAELYPDSKWQQPRGTDAFSVFDLIKRSHWSADGAARPWDVLPFGFLMIPQLEVLLCRSTVMDCYGGTTIMILVAASGVDAIHRLQDQVVKHSRKKQREIRRWSIQYGEGNSEIGHLIDEGPGFDTLDIADSLNATIQRDVVAFFRPDVADLHRSLRLPYARRVLFYGPPGTGKTSICRAVARACPGTAAFHLMPGSDFCDDDLKAIFDLFCTQAPAIMLIEDLDTLVGDSGGLKLSNFLNMLDGANSPRGDGLLIMATTNHPERLPASLANRPGRFVPVEVPLPDDVLRRRFIARSFAQFDSGMIESMVSRTDGLSFAHLNEILLVSGFAAVKAGRVERTRDDVVAAIEDILAAHKDASGGFIPKPTGKFGFAGGRD